MSSPKRSPPLPEPPVHTADSPGALEAVIAGLVPHGTRVAARRTEPSVLTLIDESERRTVAGAVTSRQHDFAAGRWCAHRTLAALGADVAVIARGRRGEPLWPEGFTGSISHTDGIAAAIAAPAAVGSLGLDIEVAGAVTDDLWDHVLTAHEQSRCAASADPQLAASRLFGIKEAAFKALYPLVHREIDFLDAVVDDDGSAVHVAVPHVSASIEVCASFTGRLVVAVARADAGAYSV
jgi:4'-phosphopantetheinyl transferase EntD